MRNMTAHTVIDEEAVDIMLKEISSVRPPPCPKLPAPPFRCSAWSSRGLRQLQMHPAVSVDALMLLQCIRCNSFR